MPSPLSFRLSETVTELLAAGSYRRSCGCPTAASAAGNRRFSESSIGTAVLTTVDEVHRSCSKVIATLFGSIGRCTVAGVVAKNCRGNPCLFGIVYHELLCCTSPSEPPFHYCRLCSEQFVVASIVVVAAVRFSRSSLVRAKVYGWPNTYVFTKAIAEMLVEQMKETISVVILRPAIVTSTFKEPFPGWVEGVRTIDSLGVAYGKGKLTCFLGNINGVVDVIPADMVVNAILVAMVAHAYHPSDAIYHVGSSVRNPVRYANLQDYAFGYFTAKPWINKDGTPVKVAQITVLINMASFRRYMFIHYLFWLKGLELANIAFCRYFQRTYEELNRKMQIVMRLVEFYRPYLFFNGIFDDMNTEKLRVAATQGGVETDLFCFDPKVISWDDYFMNTHIPGLVKYIFK